MKAIAKRSVTDQVVDQIKEMIVSGQYEVGKKLPAELELCRILDVSRSSVREAFRMLQAMDYVEIKPGRGAFVKSTRPNSPEMIKAWFEENAPQLSDFMDVRVALETLALKVVVKNAKDEEIDDLKGIEDQFEKAIDDQDVAAMAKLDEEFHSEIVNMTHNSLMINIYQLVVKEFSKYRNKSFAIQENSYHAIGPHRNILQAILERDEKLGIVYIEEHLRISKEDMDKAAHKG